MQTCGTPGSTCPTRPFRQNHRQPACLGQSGRRQPHRTVKGVTAEAYDKEPFVRLRKELPRTATVAHTNFCDISARVVKSRIIVLSAIDNMVKGAAGQAIQNMNVMFGLDEKTGLI